jgi:epoxyqueuosine reductase
MNEPLHVDGTAVLARLKEWGGTLGFSQIGVSGIDLASAEPRFAAWLHNGFHGEMDYLAAHGSKRARPAELVPGTVSVVTARLDYLPRATAPGWRAIEWDRLATPAQATVSLYARGRDYHKVLRQRLRRLADRLAEEIGPFGHRVFTDSAPVLEVELAARSGIGWRGKHTLVLDREAGSMFFLGEIYVDVLLPETPPVEAHCGSCTACIDVCPTKAIVAPYELDARRCISYLTIEAKGPIPVEYRAAIGNRIYGCDDCQLVCPWNKYARTSPLADFDGRDALANPSLLELWAWGEEAFLQATEGSAIRRIGHERWQRNLAVALGNALRASGDPRIVEALRARRETASPLVREHIDWALAQHPDAAAAAASLSEAPAAHPARAGC